MSMNAERHIKAQVDLYKAMAAGDHEQATPSRPSTTNISPFST